jgi:hypothetical protein
MSDVDIHTAFAADIFEMADKGDLRSANRREAPLHFLGMSGSVEQWQPKSRCRLNALPLRGNESVLRADARPLDIVSSHLGCGQSGCTGSVFVG